MRKLNTNITISFYLRYILVKKICIKKKFIYAKICGDLDDVQIGLLKTNDKIICKLDNIIKLPKKLDKNIRTKNGYLIPIDNIIGKIEI